VKLSDAEVKAIVAFFHTLTGEIDGKLLANENEYGVVHVHDDDHDHDHE